ncbi:OLC1v1008413C1 [Oldenlandia corymbosa var. corymbosa]|uniref:OLC1v1008413C1 n=1 Tax=Oldenlandia corymbosa var. corymbosa TaxID=529605 RepID=A0AAV1DNZ8_OLDCO|nr:OLC1v1008413C1 [Oldenlandia corymbosa var. corymbosa]
MNPFRPSQDHAEGSDQHEQENRGGENVGGGEEMGGDNVRREDDDHAEGLGQHEQENRGGENVGGREEMGGDNVRREDSVGSSRGSYTPREEEVPLTITLGRESQVLNVEPILTIRPESQEQGVRKSDRLCNPLVKFTPPTIPRRGKK